MKTITQHLADYVEKRGYYADIPKELGEQIQLDAMKEGARRAAKVADDYDGKGMDSKSYYDQCGDAQLTRKEITQAILTTSEQWTESDL